MSPLSFLSGEAKTSTPTRGPCRVAHPVADRSSPKSRWRAASRAGTALERRCGWNCEAENGSVRSSFDTTINVLDGLLAFETATGQSGRVREARRAGEEYLLERHLFRRKSTGEVVDPAYLDFAFPYYWRYDLLRVLDYFRRAGADRDPRMAEGVEKVRSKRQRDGRWLLDRIHPGRTYFNIESVGEPSRWNTLRALRVLDWWDTAS